MMKLPLTQETVNKFIDEVIIPSVNAEVARLMAEHMRIYHQAGPGVNLSIGGIDFNIKEHK
ncbi:MAG: hypothetical protein PHC68_02645 [Syntrophorhabdaceae bacterium]|nr:hypothetical protein [Syntrophorhabdaceae bacterium]